jgi:hypothetical protein
MENATIVAIPRRALQRLEFLAGEYIGRQTLYPPGGRRISYDAFCTASREACERFVKIEFYANVPNLGVESFTALLTYSSRKNCYEMWQFSSASDEPLHMTGDFKDDCLVLISDPWSMPWGLQRLRGTFTPYPDGRFEYLAEMWDPDGYSKFRHTVFHSVHAEL